MAAPINAAFREVLNADDEIEFNRLSKRDIDASADFVILLTGPLNLSTARNIEGISNALILMFRILFSILHQPPLLCHNAILNQKGLYHQEIDLLYNLVSNGNYKLPF